MQLCFLVAASALALFGCGRATREESSSAPESRRGASRHEAVYVRNYRNGFALVRYSGPLAKEFWPSGMEGENVVVLFDDQSKPIYALRPSDQQMIEFYKVVRKSNRDLIYAIPIGAAETRVYEGPFRPEEGFPKRIANPRSVAEIDGTYLNPSARDKARWIEDAPALFSLELQK